MGTVWYGAFFKVLTHYNTCTIVVNPMSMKMVQERVVDSGIFWTNIGWNGWVNHDLGVISLVLQN